MGSKKTAVERPPVQRRHVEGRTVLVCHEKHGQRFYVVDSDEELLKVAVTILRGRLKEGHWYHDPGPEPVPPDFDEAAVPKMPRSMQAGARKVLQEHKERLRFWNREKTDWEGIVQAAASADGELAWQTLRDRSDWEYERISLEPASDLSEY